jgi:hypothetical protein
MGTTILSGFSVPHGRGEGWRSTSLLLRELLPLAFVWTNSKLLVLDSLLVNSVKLNLLVAVLEVERRLSPFDLNEESSDTLLGGAVNSSLAMLAII